MVFISISFFKKKREFLQVPNTIREQVTKKMDAIYSKEEAKTIASDDPNLTCLVILLFDAILWN